MVDIFLVVLFVVVFFCPSFFCSVCLCRKLSHIFYVSPYLKNTTKKCCNNVKGFSHHNLVIADLFCFGYFNDLFVCSSETTFPLNTEITAVTNDFSTAKISYFSFLIRILFLYLKPDKFSHFLLLLRSSYMCCC